VGRDPVVLVTGAGGQVGRALRTEIPEARFQAHADLDVTDAAAVRDVVVGVDLVIHLAAMTNVDECERDPERANAVNAAGTRNVVEAVGDRARVIYVSTDYVFDGRKHEEYAEDDPPAPLNVYGRSKLSGEEYVRRLPQNLIVRTSWVFGVGRNFVTTILEAARIGGPVRVVDDQRGRPTYAQDLAASLAHLVRTRTAGFLHVAGDGEAATWADLAELALGAAGVSAAVERIDSETYRRRAGRLVAPRPANSVLSLERARRQGVPLVDWRCSVRRYVGEIA
jgi:dTDP-4-dehydrorhamnose reductase